MSPFELFIMLVGVFLAWSLFSFVFFGENAFFIFAERFYIGGTIAYGYFVCYQNLKSSCFDFLTAGRLLLIVPLIIGILIFSRLTKFRWAARYPTSILSGIGLGLVFGLSIRGDILAVITTTVERVVTKSPDIWTAIYSVVGVCSVLTMFLYSNTYSSTFHSKTGKLYYFMRLGRIFFMVSVGYLTASTVLYNFTGFLNNAVVVLIKRIYDALVDYLTIL